MAYQGVRGTGGWLGFFIATLALGCVAAAVGSFFLLVAAETSPLSGKPGWSGYSVTLAIVSLLRGVGFAFLAWLLWRRRDSTLPRVAIVVIWSAALGTAAATIIAAMFWISAPFAAAFGAMLPTTVRSIPYAVIWTAYLMRSERVADTYTGEQDELATVFH